MALYEGTAQCSGAVFVKSLMADSQLMTTPDRRHYKLKTYRYVTLLRGTFVLETDVTAVLINTR